MVTPPLFRTASVPPSSDARSRIDASPTPGGGAAANPTPSSATCSASAWPVSRDPFVQRVARAWRATLVTASTAIR